MVCPFCGAETAPGAIVCPKCHQILPLEEVKKEAVPSNEKVKDKAEEKDQPVVVDIADVDWSELESNENVSNKQFTQQPLNNIKEKAAISKEVQSKITADKKGLKNIKPKEKKSLIPGNRRKIIVFTAILTGLLIIGFFAVYFLFMRKPMVASGAYDYLTSETALVARLPIDGSSKVISEIGQVLPISDQINLNSGLYGQIESQVDKFFPDIAIRQKIFDTNIFLIGYNTINFDFGIARLKDQKTALKSFISNKDKLGKVLEESYKGSRLYSINNGASLSVLFLDGSLYISKGTNYSKQIIDNKENKSFNSLNNNKAFVALDQKISSSRASVYFDSTELISFLELKAGLSKELLSLASISEPGSQAFALAFSSDEPKADILMHRYYNKQLKSDRIEPKIGDILPNNTAILVESKNAKGTWDIFLKNVERYNPAMKASISAWLANFKKETSFDIENQFFSALSLGQHGFYLVGNNTKPEFGLVFDLGSYQDASNTLQSIKGAIEKASFNEIIKKEIMSANGQKIIQSQKGGLKKVKFIEGDYKGIKTYGADLSQFIDLTANFDASRWLNLMVVDNYLFISNSVYNLRQAVDVRKNEAKSLSSDLSFQEAKKSKPKDAGLFFYSSAGRLQSILPSLVSPATIVSQIGKKSEELPVSENNNQYLKVAQEYIARFESIVLWQDSEGNTQMTELILKKR